MSRIKQLLMTLVGLAVTFPALAHHSVALYDTDHLVTVKGVVTRIEWTSPHVFVFFKSDEAKDAEWSMELDPPVLLRRYGWSKNTVKVGDLSMEQIARIAKIKQPQLFAKTLKGAAKEVMGTCVSLGCTIEGKDPREVQAEVDEGKYDSLFQE